LEVAADNGAALRLYRRTNFTQAGRRKGYYARPGGEKVDALVLARALEPPA
jgi:ribosomal-protein-alanine N-acetyltransferase